ncbi:CBS domain-containing protein [Pinibacter aurantiacus]|uniref:CBS domain-containing protein n=1 Tax=Pinibacter aurantiacus TaxID=2851599 RepID=A0A9E2SA18_9BACT|nr:CBS domain-containing protein [Pinibacter aurantiacus]MBV4359213.1 CBS domain-containing protein [Pinibacter aurantiacus]
MNTVRDILQKKGNTVYGVSPDSSVYDALESLEERNLGALVVIENGKLIGVFTERDYARKVILKGRSSKETLVRHIMTSRPIFVTPDTTIEECMQMMTDKYIRHLPVLNNLGELVGVISIGDLVKYIITEKDSIIEHLERYIKS